MQKPFTITFSKAPKNACIHTDKTAYYHLRDCSNSMSCIVSSCHCSVSTENISMTGARSVRSMVLRRTACGVADVLDMVIVIRRMFGN